ncbi:hypothetical protein GWK47_046932 [Chionoecetes opilio]|uniref:Uncharacterized protein n=1 Tax=Chionoecetes opilio TaxID=41210 RepID=A0A8J5CUN2_CHIOP|nr:hypothetical protein GWK47_046932 [Chionoecetes opilio]
MRLFDGLQVLQEREDLRDDYREFGQTCHHFPRGAPPGGIRFLAPGAMHQARWMSKVLYSFKIWMFRGQFRLTKKEERGLQRVFASSSSESTQRPGLRPFFSVQAPRLDLELIKALGTYDKIDPEIGDVALGRNCQAICGTVRRTGWGCPSSTPTCPARPKTPMVFPGPTTRGI